MTDGLKLHAVVKRFGRRGPRALDGLSFRIPKGVVAGLVGPNGAGKTTAFSVIAGFLDHDEGEVDLLGDGPWDPTRMGRRVGVLPQDAELPLQHTPLEFLEHLARLSGASARDARSEAETALISLHLGDRLRDRISTLSHGMRRRVAVASALLGNPELVLLDEPMAGLDPVQARSLRELLVGLRGQRTVVISSHNLVELERTCDWVVMMQAGRCVRQGTVDEVTRRQLRGVFDVGPGLDPDWRLEVPGATFDIGAERILVRADTPDALDAATIALMAKLAERGIPLRAMHRGVSLEDRFVEGASRAEP